MGPLFSNCDRPSCLINLATGSGPQIEALQRITGGEFTVVFWVLFVGLCLLLPLALGASGLTRQAVVAVLAPALVVLSGYALRQVVLDVGQESTWTQYDTQYSAELFERIREQ